MSKERILEQLEHKLGTAERKSVEGVIREVAIWFADWLLKNGYGLNSIASWRNVDKGTPIDATSEILFNQYLKSQSK